MFRTYDVKYRFRRTLLRAASPLLRNRARLSAPAGSPDIIFLWIPKTAGTSIYALFQKFGMGKYKSIDRVRYQFPGVGMATFGHQSVAELVSVGAIKESYVRSAFKFAFVRNPYDRAVSLYHYFRRFDRLPPEMDFSRFLEAISEQWDEKRIVLAPVEKSLSPQLRYRGDAVSVENHTLYPVGLYNTYGWSQCRPQTEWLQGLGEIEQIQLGRMESIDDDFKVILREAFSAHEDDFCRALAMFGDSVPKRNVSVHTEYAEHYSDPGLRRLVEDIYHSDFETFGY